MEPVSSIQKVQNYFPFFKIKKKNSWLTDFETSKIFYFDSDVVVYSNIEDEIFVRHSSSNVDVNIELENDTGDEMVSYRKIMVIDATKIPLILTDLKTEIWSE